jgi:hypothetical protein
VWSVRQHAEQHVTAPPGKLAVKQLTPHGAVLTLAGGKRMQAYLSSTGTNYYACVGDCGDEDCTYSVQAARRRMDVERHLGLQAKRKGNSKPPAQQENPELVTDEASAARLKVLKHAERVLLIIHLLVVAL